MRRVWSLAPQKICDLWASFVGWNFFEWINRLVFEPLTCPNRLFRILLQILCIYVYNVSWCAMLITIMKPAKFAKRRNGRSTRQTSYRYLKLYHQVPWSVARAEDEPHGSWMNDGRLQEACYVLGLFHAMPFGKRRSALACSAQWIHNWEPS